MVTDDQLTESKAIQRETGLTFHIATRFLPKRVRNATYVLYAFFRLADDVVDDPDPAPPSIQRRELERIRSAALGEIDTHDPVLTAFNEIRDQYGIADQEVTVFIDAMLEDIADDTSSEPTAEFADTADLEEYLRGSAVAVGYMMLAIMEAEESDLAKPHAKALGEAFQLTNFLRDVREDIDQYQRVYIPQATLDRAGASVSSIVEYDPTPAFREAIRLELERAEETYRDGVAGIQYLPNDCQFPVLMAAVFYAEYHRVIRKQHFDVLTSPPSLDGFRYVSLIVRTWITWKRTGDPERTFYAIAPIKETPHQPGGSSKRSRWGILGRYVGRDRMSWLE